jgi:protein TonB
MPAARLVIAQKQPSDVPGARQLVALNAVPLASGIADQIGVLDGEPSLEPSHGPGKGGGVGEGFGTGIGSGSGPGFGPGAGGGFGGGPYRPGNGVSAPTLLKQVRPVYSADALQRRVQGTVTLEAVVSRDGVPFAFRVVRSLDPHGLDEEAIRAAKEWRFHPGRIGETPVDVLVTIVIDFRIQ